MGKKFASIVLSAATLFTFSGFGSFAHGQTVADLQAQIATLLAQIQALQAQLNNVVQGGSTGAPSCSFTRDLTVGSTGDDVQCLQQFLNANGAQLAASGPGSPGNETSFFGPLTRSALASYQATNNINPPAGYFGPITRSFLASLAIVPPPPPGGEETTVPPPASGLAVSLASDSPSDSAIAGAGQIDTLKFNLTAGTAAGVTVTDLSFTKVGVVSDTSISNLYLADESGTVVAQFSSLNDGVAVFTNLNIQVNAGQTRTLTLRTDLSTSASAGNTLAWRLDSVTAGDATVTGTPVLGNTLNVTTVSNPSIATATLTFNTVGSTVDAGTTGVLVASITANVNNSAVDLSNVKFTVVGSANMTDLKNLVFKINGTQVGSTVPNVAGDGSLIFDLSSAPARLGTGNSTIEVFADVLGSPNRTAQFTILRPFDVHIVDTEYNTGISPTVTTTNATSITINQGQITVSLASDTPTGNVPIGASNVTLAKFTIFASGEPVKVKFIDAAIIRGGGDTWATLANLTEDIENVKMVDDVGGQVGSTISTITSGSGNGACTLTSATTTTCHFGSSSSQINYTIPANTTRVLSLVVDILSTNDSTSLQGQLPGNTSNLEGQISFQTASSGSATGSNLTVVTSPLTIAANSAFSAPTYAAGANGVVIASFVITASSAEGAKVSSLTVDKDSNANFDMQNMKVMVGSTQFGTTRPTIGDAETSLSFSGATPIQVPAGGSVTVDIVGDILTSSTATTHSAVIDVTGWSAIGSTSNSAITFPGAVNGQNVVVSSGPTLTVATDSATPAAQQVVMGSTGNSLFSVRLTANNVEDVKVTDITFTDTIGAADSVASLLGLELFEGSTQIGGSLSLTHVSGSTTSTVAFNFPNPIVVTKNGSKTVSLRGDVATFSSGGATSNSSHTFGIGATTDVTALGKDSNTSATVSGTPSGNAQTVVRTKLTLSSSLLPPSTGRTRVSVDDLATLTFTADSAYQATVGTVTLKFNGLAVSNGSGAFTVDLIDANTNSSWGSSSQQTCTPGAGNSCSVTFGPQFIVSAGASKDVKVRANSSSFFNGAQTSDSLSVLVNAATDVLWNDGTTGGIGLEGTVVPFTVVNVSYE